MPSVTIGDPREDGFYLVSGLDAETTFMGRPCRWAGSVSVLRIPSSAAGQQVLLDIGVAPELRSQHMIVNAGSRKLAEFGLKAGWQECALHLEAEDISSEWLELQLECLRFHDDGWKPQCLALGRIEYPGGALEPFSRVRQPAHIFWGDPHVHSNLSLCGRPDNGSVEDNYAWAREESALDFAAVTDHAMHMSAADWSGSLAAAESANEDGVFVTLPAFEWTSELYGHRNVYYRAPGGEICDFWTVPRPGDLWRFLDAQPESLVVPHHPIRAEHLLDWAFSDDSREPLVEIYSGWGSSEYWGDPLQEKEKSVPGCSVRDALARGLRIGFVAGSDGHWHRPGCAGLTAVLADSLTRNAVWDALANRRCYATSGARILLDFRINGHMMGTELVGNQYAFRALYPLQMTVAVRGTAAISRVQIICNGTVVHEHTQSCASDLWVRGFEGEHSTTFSHVVEAPGAYCPFEGDAVRTNQLADSSRYYYVRVEQVDRHVAWSSPIFLRFVPTE